MMAFKASTKIMEYMQHRSRWSMPRDVLVEKSESMSLEQRLNFFRACLEMRGWSEEDIADYIDNYQYALKKAENMKDERLSLVLTGAIFEHSWPDTREEDFVTYDLDTVMPILVLATACGYSTCADKAAFWEEHNAELQAMLGGLMPCPLNMISAETINRLISFMGTEAASSFFSSYFSGKPEAEEPELNYEHGFSNYSEKQIKYPEQEQLPLQPMAFDGQEITSSYRPGLYTRNAKGANIITGYNVANRSAEDFVIAAKKNQEIPAIIDIVTRTSFSGRLGMSDALNVHTRVTDHIINNGGEYVFPVKANAGNKNLRLLIEAAFKENSSEIEDKFCCPFNHGRIETVELSMLPADKLSDELWEKLKAQDPAINPEAPNPRYLHKQTLSILKKTKTTCSIKKRAPQTEEDRRARERAIKHGAERPTVTEAFYICSLPCSMRAFASIVNALDRYWLIEAYHAASDRYALHQDQLSASDPHFIAGSVLLNKIALEFLGFAREEMSQDYQHQRRYRKNYKQSAEKRPVPWEIVVKTLAGKFYKMLRLWHQFMQTRQRLHDFIED